MKKIENLQIQPIYSQRERYEKIAREEGLSFEVLELSFTGCGDDRIRWYGECGLSASYHGNFIDVNPASGDPDFRNLSRDKCEESCRMAEKLGCRNIVFHGSCFPFLRGIYLDGWADLCAEFYQELTEKYHLSIFIENSMDVDTTPLKELMRRLEKTDIKVCLDLGHANYSRDPLEKWFDDIGDKIGYMHFSDNMGPFDDHYALGDGVINWDQVMEYAKYLPNDIPVTLEVGPYDGIVKSIDFLKERGYY